MPITRTAWVDDDGTGTTGTIINNAEKTTLYNQIDALVGGTTGPWTPFDGSGAGLSITIHSSRYCIINKLVIVQCHFTFATTSNTNPVAISGLPVANGPATSGLYSGYKSTHSYIIPANVTYFQIQNPATGAIRTNAEISSDIFVLSGVYLTA